MTILGKPNGIFDLNNSDQCVGSYIKKTDIPKILNNDLSDLSDIEFTIVDGQEVIDERKLQKLWYGNKIPNTPPEKRTSLDEKILNAIIKKTYPNIDIERQVRISRFLMDLKLTLNEKVVFIEFDGPAHFAMSQYGSPRKHPFYKKKCIEEKTGIEVVNWPYWIQRCQSNVKSVFEKNIKGYGALWSTKTHFGEFIFEDSANVIEKMNDRFNAQRESGVGYFYVNSENRNNPDHPIIEKIKNEKENIGRIIPKGFKDREKWLPSVLI